MGRSRELPQTLSTYNQIFIFRLLAGECLTKSHVIVKENLQKNGLKSFNILCILRFVAFLYADTQNLNEYPYHPCSAGLVAYI